METTATLADSLAAMREKTNSMLKPEIKAVMEGQIESLRAEGRGTQAVHDGTFPAFALPDGKGATVTLAGLLAKGPLVVSFFRGSWCPYCVTELKALAAAADQIARTGASLVVISPQQPSQRDASVVSELPFPILFDEGNALARQLALVHGFSDDLRGIYEGAFNIDVATHNGTGVWELPMPARYIIDRSGKIIDAQIDPDYRYRPEPSQALEQLKSL